MVFDCFADCHDCRKLPLGFDARDRQRRQSGLYGLKGWQVIFIVWGIPAVLLGFYVLFGLTDRPREAKWLTDTERDVLEAQLAKEKAEQKHVEHMSVFQGLSNPNVLMLALAYFGVVTGNYGVEMFLPAILEDWYGLGSSTVTKLAMIPSVLVIIGQLSIGRSSDYFNERRWHSILPIVGSTRLIFATLTQGNIILTMICFTIAAAGNEIVYACILVFAQCVPDGVGRGW